MLSSVSSVTGAGVSAVSKGITGAVHTVAGGGQEAAQSSAPEAFRVELVSCVIECCGSAPDAPPLHPAIAFTIKDDAFAQHLPTFRTRATILPTSTTPGILVFRDYNTITASE